jgi:hypothetical protein
MAENFFFFYSKQKIAETPPAWDIALSHSVFVAERLETE